MNLTQQAAKSIRINNAITELQEELNNRNTVWDKLPPAKRGAWARSPKDPILVVALRAKSILDVFFGKEIR